MSWLTAAITDGTRTVADWNTHGGYAVVSFNATPFVQWDVQQLVVRGITSLLGAGAMMTSLLSAPKSLKAMRRIQLVITEKGYSKQTKTPAPINTGRW